MSGETERNVSGWTLDTWAAHTEALRRADERFSSERDRRYSEVAHEREKALKIKESADETALGLAREIQKYKDEKANELREQINRERMLYATKDDITAAGNRLEAIITPLTAFVAAQQGNALGKMTTQDMFMKNIPMLMGLAISGFLALLTLGGVVVAVAYAIKR